MLLIGGAFTAFRCDRRILLIDTMSELFGTVRCCVGDRFRSDPLRRGEHRDEQDERTADNRNNSLDTGHQQITT